MWIEPRSDGAPVLVNAQAQEGFRSRTSGITSTIDQLNGKHNGASGVGTATWQQAWPHTVFIEFEDRDGERFEAEIRVTSVTQAEATEKVRDLLERLDAQVEPSQEAAFQHAA